MQLDRFQGTLPIVTPPLSNKYIDDQPEPLLTASSTIRSGRPGTLKSA